MERLHRELRRIRVGGGVQPRGATRIFRVKLSPWATLCFCTVNPALGLCVNWVDLGETSADLRGFV